MSLRELAKADNKIILNDGVGGFGWPIKLTSPEKQELNLTGFSDDIAQIIDPDTGVPVSGRLLSATLHIQDILDNGMSIPQGIYDGAKKPWIVEFNDINGVAYLCKVRNSNPDRTIGQVVLILEFYEVDNGSL